MSNYKIRYQQAHEKHFKIAYPQAYASGHYSPPKIPKISSANGLTSFVINFLMWHEHRATRINTTGRLIDGLEKQPSGAILTTKKWIPGTTRKGSADISATIKGRSVMIEIKIGKDRASEHQLREQALERKSGGVYEFISTPEQFFELYDSILVS